MKDKESIADFLGLPPPFSGLLLVLSLILALAPYFPGYDFGVLKIPLFPPKVCKRLKFIGPLLFFGLPIILHLPFISKTVPNPGPIIEELSPESPNQEVTILTPSKNENLVLKEKEPLIVRGELKNVEFDTLKKEKAYISVTMDDPKNPEPLDQKAVIPNSLLWTITFDNLRSGKRNVQISVRLQNPAGIVFSSKSIPVSLDVSP